MAGVTRATNSIEVSMSEKMTEVETMPCAVCGRRTKLQIPEDGFYNWMYGTELTEAVPDLSREEISLLTTGSHIHD